MGGCSSREVKDFDPPELATKSQQAKCSKTVGEVITEHDIDGGTAYEVAGLMRDTESADELAEVLSEYTPSKAKQLSLKAGLKKLPPEDGAGDAEAPATTNTSQIATEHKAQTAHARRDSESSPVTTDVGEWSAAELAACIKRLGNDIVYETLAKAVTNIGMDGRMMVKFDGASVTIDALLRDMKEGPEFLSELKRQKVQDLFRELRGDPKMESAHRLLVTDTARGVHINNPKEARPHLLGEQLKAGTLVTATTHKCVALVVGIAAYLHLHALRNAGNDARDVRDFLLTCTVEVILVLDATHAELARRKEEFLRLLGPGVVGLVFFAGHGVQIDGKNYLLPVDFDTKDLDQAKHDSLCLEVLLDQMSRQQALVNIIIVDACRAPLARGSTGMAPPPPAGAIVLFATSPGTTASDGAGENGLFTMHLLQALKEPVTLHEAFMCVVRAVSCATGDQQRPQTLQDLIVEFSFFNIGSVLGDEYLPPASPASSTSPASPSPKVSGQTHPSSPWTHTDVSGPRHCARAGTRRDCKSPRPAGAAERTVGAPFGGPRARCGGRRPRTKRLAVRGERVLDRAPARDE